jgi:hypothetical protein
MNKRILFGVAVTSCLAGAQILAAAPPVVVPPKDDGKPKQSSTPVLEDPTLSPGQARLDHRIEWAPEMGNIPTEIAEGAQARGLKSASGSIRCHVTVVGSMGECVLLRESPEGSGMGKVALSMSARFLVKPLMRDGKPVEAMIDILVPWAPPQGGNVGTAVDKGDMTVNSRTTYARVVWTTSASYADLLNALPAKARATNVGGIAILRCVFTDTGKLSLCHVSSEMPAGYGFANAALHLTDHFTAPAKTADGKSVEGAWVTLNVLFPPGMADGSAISVSSVQWLGQPTPQQWTSVYPPKARAADVTRGSATLSCTVDVDGGLKACGVTDETPAGVGFGAAAMAATPAFVMKVWNDDGEAMVGRTITFPLTFQTKDGAMRASIGAPIAQRSATAESPTASQNR